MPDRVVAGAVLGGVAPTRGAEAAAGGAIGLAVPLEPLLHLLREPLGGLFTLGVRSLRPFADQAFDTYLRFAPAGDKRVLGDPEVREAFIEDMMLGSRENLRSFVYDVILFSRHWGFALSEIAVPIHNPSFATFLDISQNNGNGGQLQYDNLLWYRTLVAAVAVLVTGPSTVTSSAAVTVIGWATFQFAAVNVSRAGDTVASLRSLARDLD